MAVVINHIIVHCRNKEESAAFLADVLGLPAPTSFHRFQVVRLDNGATLDFLDSPEDEIVWEHFAFLVDESDFDAVLARIQQRNIQFWSDPFCKLPGQINTDDGGRSIYFKDPNNHLLEILTVPYGGERLAAKYVP
jgi:catechol 2,3-dioxygenase-like lactoylglutathione lyase family enzyme